MIAEYDPKALYRRWVIANGVAELIGLGSTFASVAGVWALIDRSPLGTALLLALGIALSGAVVEGTAVGLFQWSVLRGPLPALRPLPYAAATGVGAFLAWAAGMLPSTLMSAAANASSASGPAFDPPLGLQLALAAAMGAVLGPFLAVPQWLVLRRHLPHAGWWVPANVTAWAFGMPMVFLGTGLIQQWWPAWAIALVLVTGTLLAGLVVGAVHGVWLLWLLGRAEAEENPARRDAQR